MLAAAQAVKSWARARRATWTDAPLIIGDVTVSPGPPPPSDAAPVRVIEKEAAPDLDPGPSVWSETVQPAIREWAPRIALGGLLVAALAVAVKYAPQLWRTATTSAARVTAFPTSPTPASSPPTSSARAPQAAAAKATGSINVSSTPSGARVLVDGNVRGVTPLRLDDLALGRHTIVLESSAGIIQRVVAVAPGTTTEIDESIFSGWVVIYAPFELSVTEGTRTLRVDDSGEIMLPAGPHELRFANRALGFQEIRRVDLQPGARATISIKPPRSSMTITASEPSEVWIDGTRLGETPLAGAPVDLGTHELLVKRVAGGERRLTITATVQPIAVNVDFSKPPV